MCASRTYFTENFQPWSEVPRKSESFLEACCPPPQKLCPPMPQIKLHFVLRSMESRHFQSPSAPCSLVSPPCRPLILNSLATPLQSMNFRDLWVRSKLKGGALHNVPSNMGAAPAGMTVRRSTRGSRSGSNAMPLHGQAGALMIRIWHECYLLRALSSLTWDYIDLDLRSRSRRSVFSTRVKHTCAQFHGFLLISDHAGRGFINWPRISPFISDYFVSSQTDNPRSRFII